MFGFGKKEKENQLRKYIVMGKFKFSDRYILEKQFINKHSADDYVNIMKENSEYNDYEYFLFEQSKDYNYEEKNDWWYYILRWCLLRRVK